jgi:hypothetical protein
MVAVDDSPTERPVKPAATASASAGGVGHTMLNCALARKPTPFDSKKSTTFEANSRALLGGDLSSKKAAVNAPAIRWGRIAIEVLMTNRDKKRARIRYHKSSKSEVDLLKKRR